MILYIIAVLYVLTAFSILLMSIFYLISLIICRKKTACKKSTCIMRSHCHKIAFTDEEKELIKALVDSINDDDELSVDTKKPES